MNVDVGDLNKVWEVMALNRKPKVGRFWRKSLNRFTLLCINGNGSRVKLPLRILECEELMNKGVTGTGEGSDLHGKRLGGFSCQPPLSTLRPSAFVAAENSVKIQSLIPCGPKLLGGDSSIMTVLSPVQPAAMVAKRRAQDDIWCRPHSFEEFNERVLYQLISHLVVMKQQFRKQKLKSDLVTKHQRNLIMNLKSAIWVQNSVNLCPCRVL